MPAPSNGAALLRVSDPPHSHWTGFSWRPYQPYIVVVATVGTALSHWTLQAETHPAAAALALACAAAALFFLARVRVLGPGRVPPGWRPPGAGEDEEPASGEGPHHRHAYFLRVRPCPRCRAFKPPRAHHCSVCKACSLRMDHHCDVAAQCVGAGNMGSYVAWLACSAVGLAVPTATLLFAAPPWAFLSRHPAALAFCVGTPCLLGPPLFIMLARAVINHGLRGVTQIEVWERHWLTVDAAPLPPRPWPYDKGTLLANLADSFFPPGNGLGYDSLPDLLEETSVV